MVKYKQYSINQVIKREEHRMIDLHPSKCNICGGEVVFTSNSEIYGKEYGSGRMYYCTECGAYVGTHIPNPSLALGILANDEMRIMKMRCHELFDEQWKHVRAGRKRHLARENAYRKLAIVLGIPFEECHFGYFDLCMLHKAYELLSDSDLYRNKLREKIMVG